MLTYPPRPLLTTAKRQSKVATSIRIAIKVSVQATERIPAINAQKTANTVAIHGLGIDHNHSIGMVEPEKIHQFTMEKVKGLAIDGVFLSCTNFRAMEVYKDLQEELGVPVITSNQVALESALEVLQK
jgi:maleate isomerase